MSIAARALAVALAAFAPLAVHAEADAQAIVLSGARAYTLDPAQPWASAVVIRDGRIAYVGDDAGARKAAGPGARDLALEGRMLLPGLHDSHIHPMSGAMRLLRCRLGELPGARDVYAEIVRCAAAKPKGTWVLGAGWRLEQFGPDGPTRAKLDEFVPNNPAFVTTEDGFTAWANTKALQAAGLVDKKKSRRQSGVLDDPTATRIRRVIPTPSEAEYREALQRAIAMANRLGITSMVDTNASPAMVDAYLAANLAGELRVRVVAAQRVDPARGPEQVDEMRARRDRARGPRFRADAAKIFLDGETDRHTAAMLEPYADAPGERGALLIERERLDAVVARLDAEGFMIHMHAMGDGAVRAGLDAIERAIAANGPRDRRHQIAHVGVANAEDIARFGKLGVAADFSPIWAQAGDPPYPGTEAALGPARTALMYPIGAVLRAGGRVVASSDWPQPSMNPLDGMQYAITRQPLDGGKDPVQPDQRVTLADMIGAYTREAAWVAREDALDGTIEVGKAADLVVLERDLFAVEPHALHEMRVMLTLLDGEPVWRDDAIPWPGAAKP
jgi:predicted amidohydrolase YtcJ